ncbi:hypothetical protein F441_04336 [Phytophthora nicotianae CJ01A1]|uniref:PiggyBac transposable element-derived protein domain-containing protein n=2 Tax=Phytophthora nicotianae TaxID=4792 RepID=W2XHH6_PHYNI|nr:hypothetical protein F444_04390 [Phytophthora nicotianae P1976]ETP22320.1 hypothetical protein F441_04336 [Phytophthora nicotianae CJ01A1]
MWYFLRLISVAVFGIHSHPDKRQWNLIYSERKAKKGSAEVISMLDTMCPPPELRDDPLYIVPDEHDQEEVAAKKKSRPQKVCSSEEAAVREAAEV